MALHIIIGDTSCGKSALVCKRLAQESAAALDKRFIAIVPEQATLLMQKNLIEQHPKKVITNIDIVSFGFLAEMVFRELGKTLSDILDDTGKALILRKVLDERRGDLQVYGRKVKMPGFVEEIKSIITELKQYGIDDNELFLMQEAAGEQDNRLLYAKLGDLRLIYRAFEEEIAERYTTAEEILTVLAGCAASSAIIRDAEIYMDGFTGFTPVQYRLIEQLLLHAANVTVTVTLPEEQIAPDCTEHELFALSNRTYFKLLELAERAGVRTSTEVCMKDPERVPEKTQEVKIFAAKNPEEEVLFTAATIVDLVRHHGWRFRDFAVVVSDMEGFHQTVRHLFDDAGISYFIDHKRKLSENVLAHFLLSAIRMLSDRFSYEAVFAYLKTGLTDLSEEEICKIENYCLEFGIRGIRAFREPFTKNRKRGVPWDMDLLNAAREKLMDSVGAFYRSISGSGSTAEEYRTALTGLFEKNRIAEKIDAMAEEFSNSDQLSLGKEYEQIYEQITELLAKIENILSHEKLSPAEYFDIVLSGLEETKIGIIPPSLDAVMVGDLTRTRLSKIKALFLIGANDGKIPKVSGGSAIFSQRERQFLKTKDFEIAPTVLENIYTQRFYIYLMLSKPEDDMWITYAQMAQDGSSLRPSYLIQDLPLPLTKVPVEVIPDAEWEAVKMHELAQTIRTPDPAVLNYFAKSRPERIRQIISAAFFNNRQLPIDAHMSAELYGKVLRGSVSRYEKFAECPFKHFMQYGIRAEKRPEYEVKATDIGTVYHDSLEKYSKKLAENGLTFRDISDEESHRLIRECVEEAVSSMEIDVLESTARNEFLKERIVQVSEKTTDVLRSQVKDGKYDPAFFEMKFTTDLSDEVCFTGKIDRVDIYDGDDVFVKIIDYKSGSKKFDVEDLYTGEQLQLVAYLNEALQTAKEKYPGRNVHPGGVYYYLIQDEYKRSEDDLEKKYRMSGLTNCDKEALSAIDTTVDENNPGKSLIVDIKYGKNGLDGSSKVANSVEFEHMLSFVNEKIGDISSRIKAGEVDIAPLYKNDTGNACRFCDYKDVCKFEDGHYGTEWKKPAEEVSKADMEHEIFGRVRPEDTV